MTSESGMDALILNAGEFDNAEQKLDNAWQVSAAEQVESIKEIVNSGDEKNAETASNSGNADNSEIIKPVDCEDAASVSFVHAPPALEVNFLHKLPRGMSLFSHQLSIPESLSC